MSLALFDFNITVLSNQRADQPFFLLASSDVIQIKAE